LINSESCENQPTNRKWKSREKRKSMLSGVNVKKTFFYIVTLTLRKSTLAYLCLASSFRPQEGDKIEEVPEPEIKKEMKHVNLEVFVGPEINFPSDDPFSVPTRSLRPEVSLEVNLINSESCENQPTNRKWKSREKRKSMLSGVNIKKLFFLYCYTDPAEKCAGVFVPGKFFQPDLIFVGMHD